MKKFLLAILAGVGLVAVSLILTSRRDLSLLRPNSRLQCLILRARCSSRTQRSFASGFL